MKMDRIKKDRVKGFALIALVSFALCALSVSAKSLKDDDTPKPLPPLQKNFPLDQTFSLRELNDKAVPSDLDVSFKLDSSFRASGFSGCNTWSATAYPQKNQHVLVGGLAMTHKPCSPLYESIERSFLQGLITGMPSWDLVNGDLIIKGPGGRMRLAHSL